MIMTTILTRLHDLWRAPSRRLYAILWAVTLCIAQLVASTVLSRNQFAGVYPPEADSIGIPLMAMFFGHVAMYPIMLLGMVLLRRSRPVRVLGYAIFVAILLDFLREALSWANPRHYEITLAMGAASALVGVYLVREWRRSGKV
jgi:hypothetical protein